MTVHASRGDRTASAMGPEEAPLHPLTLAVEGGTVSLGFVQEADDIFLVGRDRSARWPVDILRRGEATVRVGEREVRGSVELITSRSERDGILEQFRAKYGAERYERWYGNPSRVLRLRLARGPTEPPFPDRYTGCLEAEFDNVAADYDHHILDNRINRLLRDRSLSLLRPLFSGRRHLLEIGCGSGMETLPLLREGHELYCVDISERMLEVVRAKAREEGLSERLRTRRLTASEIAELAKEVGTGAFEGAYSTFGALNCEPDLRRVARGLHPLLRPDGRFLAGVYNRWCLFELLGYGVTGRFGRAFGRAANPVRVGASRFCVDVYSYSAATFYSTFRDEFVRVDLRAVPILLPPSDLVQYAERFARRFELLERWDRSWSKRWPFSVLGDHFLMTLAPRP